MDPRVTRMMPALLKYLICAVLVFFAYWACMIVVTNFKDNHAYISSRRDEALLLGFDALMKKNIAIKLDQPSRITDLLEPDQIRALKNDGYNLNKYSAYLHDRDLLVYRNDPALDPAFLLKNAPTAFQFSYDPTNGIYSQGFIFKVIRSK
ncbi:hypothetical protein LLG95_03395 [bacterium]|nr:hypothetical protein [bacterium]